MGAVNRTLLFSNLGSMQTGCESDSNVLRISDPSEQGDTIEASIHSTRSSSNPRSGRGLYGIKAEERKLLDEMLRTVIAEKSPNQPQKDAPKGESSVRNQDPVASPASAFINAPFHDSYESLWLVFISCLACLHIRPRIITEVSDGGVRYLKIINLILACEYSLHELSYMKWKTLKGA